MEWLTSGHAFEIPSYHAETMPKPDKSGANKVQLSWEQDIIASFFISKEEKQAED